MSTYYVILTDLGQASLTQAMGLGQTLDLTHIALGDGNGVVPTPTEADAALVNEVHRRGITSLTVDPVNPNWLIIEAVLPTDIGGWTIREVGIYDTDGVLFAIGNFPATYKPILAEGSAREMAVRIYVQVSNTAAVTLVVDPSVVFATRTYVDNSFVVHAASRNHPDATSSAKGFMRIATPAEATAGTDGSKAIVPATLAAALAAAAKTGRARRYFMGS